MPHTSPVNVPDRFSVAASGIAAPDDLHVVIASVGSSGSSAAQAKTPGSRINGAEPNVIP